MCQLSDDQPKHIQSLDQTITSLTKALADWTDAIRSNQRSVLSEDVKDSLIEQIARLERQLCDVSLQYQIERRRRRMVENEVSCVFGLCKKCDCLHLLSFKLIQVN